MSLPNIAYGKLVALVIGLLAVSGCTESRLRMSPDYGSAFRQDVAAQIADPDAHYAGDPAPGSNGARTELALKRYEQHKVIEPTVTNTMRSTAQNSGSGGGEGSTSPSGPQ